MTILQQTLIAVSSSNHIWQGVWIFGTGFAENSRLWTLIAKDCTGFHNKFNFKPTMWKLLHMCVEILWLIPGFRRVSVRRPLSMSSSNPLTIQVHATSKYEFPNKRCWIFFSPWCTGSFVEFSTTENTVKSRIPGQPISLDESKGQLTSPSYILNMPSLSLFHEATAEMFHNWFECSWNGPLFV